MMRVTTVLPVIAMCFVMATNSRESCYVQVVLTRRYLNFQTSKKAGVLNAAAGPPAGGKMYLPVTPQFPPG
jgi:hypothetical protein